MSPIALSDMSVVATFSEVDEILRSGAFVQGMHQGRLSHPFLGDTLLTLSGDEHFARRRLENGLFKRELLTVYEADLLRPALTRRLAELRQSDDGRPVRIDLVELARTVLQVIAAKVIGLDGVEDDRSLQRLRMYAGAFGEAATVEWSTDGHEQIIDRGLAAMREFVAEFYTPARARREALLTETKVGTISQEELPTDLLTLLLAHAADAGIDDEVILRETVLYVIGSSATITQTCAHSVWLLAAWFDAHPEDLALCSSIDFLRRATNESLRLYPPSIGLVRRAIAPVTLASGHVVAAGEHVFLDLVASNRDREMFGADASEFNPHRRPAERSRPFGLAFGGGPHMCIGRPLASGGLYQQPHGSAASAEPVGVVACLLQELFAAGIGLDPERPPLLKQHTVWHEFTTFPVTFAFE